MKKFTPLDSLPAEAATLNRQYLRVWADGIKARGCPVCIGTHGGVHTCVHMAMLNEIADSFIQLDDHMKGGGELPTGWSFFSQNERNGE